MPNDLVEPGNIDISNRPKVYNADGTISTEKSFSIGTDKGEVLIPQVVGGKMLTKEDALKHYKTTGEHLGIFKTIQGANTYAKALHERQGQYVKGTTMADDDDAVSAAQRRRQRTGQSYFPAANAVGWSNSELMRPPGLSPRGNIEAEQKLYHVQPPQAFNLNFHPGITSDGQSLTTPTYGQPPPSSYLLQTPNMLRAREGSPLFDSVDMRSFGQIMSDFGNSVMRPRSPTTGQMFGLGMNQWQDWHQRYGFNF